MWRRWGSAAGRCCWCSGRCPARMRSGEQTSPFPPASGERADMAGYRGQCGSEREQCPLLFWRCDHDDLSPSPRAFLQQVWRILELCALGASACASHLARDQAIVSSTKTGEEVSRALPGTPHRVDLACVVLDPAVLQYSPLGAALLASDFVIDPGLDSGHPPERPHRTVPYALAVDLAAPPFDIDLDLLIQRALDLRISDVLDLAGHPVADLVQPR